MNRLRRFYNQNSKGIWMTVVIIFLLFLLLQLVNYWAKEKNKEENNNYNIAEENIQTENNINVRTNKSVVTGEKKATETLSKEIQVIQTFLNDCIKGNIEEAYEMLTEECKEEMYGSIDDFRKFYCENNFKSQNMNFDIENWVNDTYRVTMYPDALATGQVTNNQSIQDHITIKENKSEYKLNINNYIKRDYINKENENSNIKFTIESRNVYMDYESYNIKIKNNTGKDILLDSKQRTDSMFIKDKKGVKYSAANSELTIPDLTVQNLQEKNITIKYYSSYNSSKKIEKIGFANVIMDYDRMSGVMNRESLREITLNI